MNKYIKKIIGLLLSLTLLFSTVSTVMANNGISVTINGQQVAFDVPPQIINNRTMVPLRAIFEALNATVDWDDETQTITSTKGNTTMRLTINDSTMYVNETSVALDSPACLVDDRTLVPIRAISEAFDMNVDWNEEKNEVSITPQYYSGSASFIKYNSQIYESVTEVSGWYPNHISYQYNTDTYEMYGDDFLLLLSDYSFNKGTGNSFTNGGMEWDLYADNYSLDRDRDYISMTEQLRWATITYNNKKFTGITAKDYLNQNLKNGDVGIWNGVRFAIDQYGSIYYNFNDLANYFGISRTFYVEQSENNTYIVITEN